MMKKSLTLLACLFFFPLSTGLFAQDQVADTKFSHNRGFYSSPFQLEITTATVGATIRYTLDGTAPSETHGAVYTAPIAISSTTIVRAMAYKSGFEPTNIDAQTFIFPDDIIAQPSQPAGFPSRWYSIDGDYVEAKYDMNPDYPDGAQTIKNALTALPSLSVVMDPDDLFGPSGIYNNGDRDNNSQHEKACSIEFIYPDDDDGFQVNCGIQPRSQRASESRKRGFRFDFKSMYGPTKLRKNILKKATETSAAAVKEFDSIILRSGYMENYTGKIYDPAQNIYFRDIMTRDAQIAVSGYGTHNQFVNVFLNGLYWGVYNLTEAFDEDFMVSYFGGDASEWFIAKSNADSHDDGQFVTGDPSRYTQLLQLCEQDNVDDPLVYAQVKTLIDPALFADYIILQNYFAVGDWPDNNWVFVQKNSTTPEPGFFFVWDAEKALLEGNDPQSYKHARYSPYLWDDSEEDFVDKGLKTVPARIWNALIKNPDFLATFSDRVYRHLQNDGVLSNENLLDRFDELTNLLSLPIRADQKRWANDDNREQQPGHLYTHDDWQNRVNSVRQNILNNADYFIEDFRAHGLYPSIEPPLFSHPGGEVQSGFAVTIDNPNGTGVIYYTHNGDDPRADGGAVAGSAVNGGNSTSATIQGTTTIKARIKTNDEWSALHQATYYAPGDLSTIKITELMYHPPDVDGIDGDEFEFIEIKNTGTGRVNISKLAFTNGIAYQFGSNLFLDAQEFVVLAHNKAMFYEKYRMQAFDEYSGKLNNGGERVTLSDALGNTIFTVKYDDKAPWPAAADSGGYSLVPTKFNENPDPDNAANWRASLFKLGSPGFDDSTEYIPPDPKPEAKNILFVVGDENLNKDDQAVYNRLVILGHQITILAASSASAASANGMDAVLISETVSSSELSDTFSSTPLPIMIWEPYIYDDMKMTGISENIDFGKLQGTTINISSSEHSLAAGLSGDVRVLQNAIESSWGKPSNSAEVIAIWQGQASKAALFAYEKGANMVGMTAPERRIGFFFNDGVYDETTNQGWKLFDAAVTWVLYDETTTVATSKSRQPNSFVLRQNYPNPFNPTTRIDFIIKQDSHVKLDIFNMAGQKVAALIDDHINAGMHTVVWSAQDAAGTPLPSGVYFYRISVDDHHIIARKMLLIK